MSVGLQARQRAANYRKALRYLQSCGEITLAKVLKAGEIGGFGDRAEFERMWNQADDVMPTRGEPGGKEFVRHTLCQTLKEGIDTFDSLATELGEPEKKWWQIWK